MKNLKAIAIRNRKYYLSEQKFDHKTEPWFRYVRTLGPYAELVLITPSMANQALDSDFSLRKSNNCENGVVISISGKILEGQKLLKNIVDNNESAIVTVTFNVVDTH